MKIRYCFTSIIMVVFFIGSASALTVENWHLSSGTVLLRFFGGQAPYEIYKSAEHSTSGLLEDMTWGLVDTADSNEFRMYGLENGVTHYFKVVDASGSIYYSTYTPPLITIDIDALSVSELKDTWVHLKWSKIYNDVNLYVNGSFIQRVKGSEFTVTGLSPNTKYVFHFETLRGNPSNTVIVTTPNDMSSFLGKLNNILEDLFISDDFQIDSNGDGVVDGYQPIHDSITDIGDNGLVQLPGQVGDIVGDAGNNIGSLDPGKNPSPIIFEVDLGALGTVDLLSGLAFFKDEIIMIRRLLVAILYSSVVFYFIKLMIPSLRA